MKIIVNIVVIALPSAQSVSTYGIFLGRFLAFLNFEGSKAYQDDLWGEKVSNNAGLTKRGVQSYLGNMPPSFL